MIGIIGALSEELDAIKKLVKNIKEENKSIRTFYTGKIHNKDVVIVQAGIGKVNAGITTSLLIENYDIKYIINIGVAGGQNGVKHKDLVVSEEVLYHDVDVTNFGEYPHGKIPGMEPTFSADDFLLSKTKEILNKTDISYKIGKIASGDQFVYSKEKIKEINELYSDIYAIEMEAAAIAHTATLYKIPFIVYRSISDVLEDGNQNEDFYKFLSEAAFNTAIILEKLIMEL